MPPGRPPLPPEAPPALLPPSLPGSDLSLRHAPPAGGDPSRHREAARAAEALLCLGCAGVAFLLADRRAAAEERAGERGAVAGAEGGAAGWESWGEDSRAGGGVGGVAEEEAARAPQLAALLRLQGVRSWGCSGERLFVKVSLGAEDAEHRITVGGSFVAMAATNFLTEAAHAVLSAGAAAGAARGRA